MAPAIDWKVFEQRVPAIFEASRLNVLQVATEDSESIPLPFYHRLRSLLSWRETSLNVATGFPESVSHWTLKRIGGPVLECLARYHKGKAVCLIIRSTNSGEQEKHALRDEIAKAFPYLKITLENICPSHGSGAPF